MVNTKKLQAFIASMYAGLAIIGGKSVSREIGDQIVDDINKQLNDQEYSKIREDINFNNFVTQVSKPGRNRDPLVRPVLFLLCYGALAYPQRVLPSMVSYRSNKCISLTLYSLWDL